MMYISRKSLFYSIMITLIGAFFISILINPLGSQMNVFYWRCGNLFGDFFNVEIFISDRNPYYNTYGGVSEHCYPPLAYAIMYLFHGFFDYQNAKNFEECLRCKESIISCIFFMVFTSLIFLHALSKMIKIQTIDYIIVICSSIFLFSFERGNLIFLSVAFVFYYMAYKDSPISWKRNSALLVLSLASAIKIYPALFGLYLVKEKRYRDIIKCIILFLILFFVPFLFFENGINNFVKLLSNLAEYSKHYSSVVVSTIIQRYSISDLFVNLFKFLHSSPETIIVVNYITRIVSMLFCLISVLAFFYEKQSWQSYFILTMVLLYFPEHSVVYCGLYLIPSVFMFLNKEEIKWQDSIYLLLFCFFLNPFQIIIHNISFSYILSNISLLAMWFLIMIDSYKSWRMKRELL